jgi:hypothetical protein
MHIDVYCTLRNERQIIPYFLKHYGLFADRIFMWDDQSDDGTREILAAHPKVQLMSLPANVPRGVQDQYWVERLWPQYKEISRDKADWVMIVDADEFIYHDDLLLALQDCLDRGVDIIICHGYLMIADSFPTTGGQIYDEVKHGIRDRMCDKWIIFNPRIDVEFMGGRHRRPRRLEPADTIVETDGFKQLHMRAFDSATVRARYARNMDSINIGLKQVNLPPITMDYYEQPHTFPNTSGQRGNIFKWLEDNRQNVIKVVP